MTLEEAIVHAEDTAKSAIGCECREEHRQLAEWLKELQETRKERDYWQEKAHSYEQTIFKLTDAISKQPVETGTNVGDTISRQVAIDAIGHIGHIATMPDGDKCIRRSAVKYTLSMLPPAQPERKKGKWIKNDNGTYSCSLCHSWIPEEQYYYAQFCLHCGAYMKGEPMGLIDADVLKQHIDKLPALPDGNFAGNHSALKALINMQPTVQPEIIHCGECAHSNKEYSGEMWCGICNGFGIDENSFCSFAERRTDEK